MKNQLFQVTIIGIYFFGYPPIVANSDVKYTCRTVSWANDFQYLAISTPNARGWEEEFERVCGPERPPEFYRLDFETGGFHRLEGPSAGLYSQCVVDEPRQRAFCLRCERMGGCTHINVDSLKTGKTLMALPFTAAFDETIPEMKVSTDGSRIWARWPEGGEPLPIKVTHFIGVFDGKSYKLLKKEEEGKETILWPESFIGDGHTYYSHQRHPGKRSSLVITDVKSGSVLKDYAGQGFTMGVKDLKGGVELQALGTKTTEGTWTGWMQAYNLETRQMSRKIDVGDPYMGGCFQILTPDGQKAVLLRPLKGEIIVYDLWTDTEPKTITTGAFDVKPLRGGINYYCPDSSCLIYNTTKELLRVDLAEGKLAQRIPIQYPEGVQR